MLKPIPNYEVTNYETLNKFLMGTLSQIKRKEITIEEAQAISQVSDKIIKNNLTAIMHSKMINSSAPLDFYEPKEKQILIG